MGFTKRIPEPLSATRSRFAFGEYDEVIIDGISYRPSESNEFGYTFRRTDLLSVAESFTHAMLSQRVNSGEIEHRRDAFLPDHAKRRLNLPTQELSALSLKQQQKAKYHESLIRAFLEMEAEGKVKRTEESVKAALAEIKFRASKYLSVPSEGDPFPAHGNTMIVPTKISASRLLKRVAAFRRDGMAALYDQGGQGRRSRRLGPDELALLARTVRNYLTMEQPSVAQVVEDVDNAFIAENLRRQELRKREAAGEKLGESTRPLVTPSRETIHLAGRKLDPFEVDIARFGLEEARKRNAPVGKGLELTRPFERVEMDEWQVDVMAPLAESGIWSILSQEEKSSLGLEEGKMARWFLTAAECCTTRCVVAMKLSRSPSKRSAMQTMDMIVRDKGVWADAVGAHSPWNMSGTPELIVTDCGSAFIDFDTRVGATDLGINIDAGPAGMPEFRARIERLFGTMANNFIGRLTGRTFSNTVVKGDYDSEARAALTAEELSEALVRWVVDVYHRRPHAGLNGETPLNCWNRLVGRYGVAPMPALGLRRRALGTRLKRTVSKKGISVLGIRYHSEVLARWFMHNTEKEVRVRWYSEDLGAIAVELDGKWIEVPSVFERFHGERAQTWMLAVREVRASVAAQKKIDQEVIFNAMTRLREINANAIARQWLFVDDYSKERIAELEDRYLIGFEVDETPDTLRLYPASDGLGIDLPTAPSVTQPERRARDPVLAAPNHASHAAGAPNAFADPDADWSFGDK
ncbi:Mu transposase C-terminal domain-containing protein [Sagittula stellata]|uniref:Integrase, catalytic domain n=2 Tax=Sagittula stellata TaxID=52603 RepID=A3JY68_SAGS3|nr:Mu transposase C-terminal domain-containing protein [Sagittula stellata]EBA10454.1 Integrase, catalytic domain [Sagittula stellata E-37]